MSSERASDCPKVTSRSISEARACAALAAASAVEACAFASKRLLCRWTMNVTVSTISAGTSARPDRLSASRARLTSQCSIGRAKTTIGTASAKPARSTRFCRSTGFIPG